MYLRRIITQSTAQIEITCKRLLWIIHTWTSVFNKPISCLSNLSFHPQGTQRAARNQRRSRRPRPDRGEGECGGQMFAIHRVLPGGLCVSRNPGVNLFLNFREKMARQVMGRRVVLVSRWGLKGVDARTVWQTVVHLLDSQHLCLLLGLSWVPGTTWWAGKLSNFYFIQTFIRNRMLGKYVSTTDVIWMNRLTGLHWF